MAKRKREQRTYNYECTLTGESYTVTAKSENPDDLVSVEGFYELNPDRDDRPEDVKIKLGKTEK